MQAEQFMTGESESYNNTSNYYSCKVAKKRAGKKACNCCFRGVAICFLARLYHALIKSSVKRVCD